LKTGYLPVKLNGLIGGCIRKQDKNIDGIEAMHTLYGKPKKKRKKRKVPDAKIRPSMKWKNRKTKSE
jgi:hypothetical protein